MCLTTELLPPHTHPVKDPLVLVCILEQGQAEKGRVPSADCSMLSIATLVNYHGSANDCMAAIRENQKKKF